MSDDVQKTRREMLALLAALPFVPTSAFAVPEGKNTPAQASDNLVVYHSRSGNTRVIAGIIQRAVNADIYEILPRTAYPADYPTMVEQASRERKSGYNPPLLTPLENVARYKTVYLGFPIWGMSLPSVVRSFLVNYPLANVNVIPFITHGGYGIGDSMEIVASLIPHASVQQPFVMQADQERHTTEVTLGWLNGN